MGQQRCAHIMRCDFFLPTFAPLVYIALFASLLVFVPMLRIPLLVYMAWGCWVDSGPFRGAWYRRLTPWARSHLVWRFMAQYFPVTIVKTAELDANRNYVFACHPHGVISFGVIVCTATEGANFSSFFPGSFLVCEVPCVYACVVRWRACSPFCASERGKIRRNG